MRVSVKNAIREWVSSLTGILIIAITGYKFYSIFEVMTIAQTFMIMTFFILGISLIFVKDSFLKELLNKLLNRK